MFTSTGWKGKTAGWVAMIHAAIGFGMHFVDPASPIAVTPNAALTEFAMGLGILGIRLKLG